MLLNRLLAPGLATTIGGLLLSANGRRIAGRLAGPLGLGVIAYGLWRQYRDGQADAAHGGTASPAGSSRTRARRAPTTGSPQGPARGVD